MHAQGYMLRVVSFVLDIRDLGLKLQLVIQQGKDERDLLVYTDSEWAGDSDSRALLALSCS